MGIEILSILLLVGIFVIATIQPINMGALAFGCTFVLGSLIIGMIQAFNEGPFIFAPGSDWTRSIVFGILIAILVFRPEGLLGERTPEGA